VFLHSLPQKITPALKVRAVACTHSSAQTAPTFRECACCHAEPAEAHAVMPFALAASFVTAALVSCIPLRSVVLITLHYVAFTFQYTRSLRLGHRLPHKSTHITTNFIHFFRKVHSTSFRFIPSSFTQQAAVHPLPLLCSPALSSGLRAVMLFASRLVGHCTIPLLSTNHPTRQKITPALVRSVPTFLLTFLRCLHFSHSSHRTYCVRALCSHPTSCSRDSFHSVPFALGRLARLKEPIALLPAIPSN
jgi:hypothetical protein